jgi:DNA-binding MarR family transcriptional regulator
MERAGFLERQSDPQDQRVSRVYLTDEGREIRGAVEELWAELEGQTLEGFSDEEREALERFLERIYENLEGEDL